MQIWMWCGYLFNPFYPGTCKTKAFMNRIATAQIEQTAIVFAVCIAVGIGNAYYSYMKLCNRQTQTNCSASRSICTNHINDSNHLLYTFVVGALAIVCTLIRSHAIFPCGSTGCDRCSVQQRHASRIVQPDTLCGLCVLLSGMANANIIPSNQFSFVSWML